MKKLSKILLNSATALIISLFPIACGGSNSEPDDPQKGTAQISVSITPESLSPDFNSQTLEVSVKANVDWSISSDADWISFRPGGGVKNSETVVKVSIDKNNGLDSRSAVINIISSNSIIKSIPVTQGYIMVATPSISSLILSGEDGKSSFTVSANGEWSLSTDATWLSISPDHGNKGETSVEIRAGLNESDQTRNAALTLTCGESISTINVAQLNYKIEAPEGYTLVWSDEFNVDGRPSSDWVHENWAAGYVNHELQTYTSHAVDGKYTTEVKDGFLYINCFKGNDGKIYSGRMNAKPATGWTYGYFEARINLPSGKGTWPAFWMMPSNVDWNTNPWPYCGEIDIMEEVGVDANKVSSSLHTGNYNHTIGTQKTHEMFLAGAEGEFHTYGLEWTEDAITTYVDGKVQLRALKSEMGDDHASWPFHYAFYPILNLAWGGDWGGYAGVNENALPVTMLVDYVRVFQKQ